MSSVVPLKFRGPVTPRAATSPPCVAMCRNACQKYPGRRSSRPGRSEEWRAKSQRPGKRVLFTRWRGLAVVRALGAGTRARVHAVCRLRAVSYPRDTPPPSRR